MTTKPKRAARQQGNFDKELASSRGALRRTKTIPKAAATLAFELLGVVAKRRGKRLTEDDAVVGSVAASLLTALATGTTRAEFVAWLRRTARILASPKSSVPPSSNHPKGN